MVETGVVHGDLSVFNLLWWEARSDHRRSAAVDIGTTARPSTSCTATFSNVAGWFRAKGIDFDADQQLSELAATAFGSR